MSPVYGPTASSASTRDRVRCMSQVERPQAADRSSPSWAGLVVRFAAGYCGVAFILFAAAGRLDWTRGWVFLGLSVLIVAANAPLIIWKNPSLVAERFKRRRDTKPFDKVFMALYIPSLFAVLVVAGLDAGRFAWSSPPQAVLYVGILLFAMADIPLAWAMMSNPFAETTVRIQKDRGQTVVTTGPYRFVRHPMYAGGIVMFASWPLVLGSLWAYVPVAVVVALFVFRTAFEDRTLRAELPGYEEYARKTRYRLVPFIW